MKRFMVLLLVFVLLLGNAESGRAISTDALLRSTSTMNNLLEKIQKMKKVSPTATPKPTPTPSGQHGVGEIGNLLGRIKKVSPTATPKPTPVPPIQRGDEGEDVEKLQQLLIEFGYLAQSEDDGKFGPITAMALHNFKEANDMVDDSEHDPEWCSISKFSLDWITIKKVGGDYGHEYKVYESAPLSSRSDCSSSDDSFSSGETACKYCKGSGVCKFCFGSGVRHAPWNFNQLIVCSVCMLDIGKCSGCGGDGWR